MHKRVLRYHAACKVEYQPFKRSYSQLTFFNFLYQVKYTRYFEVYTYSICESRRLRCHYSSQAHVVRTIRLISHHRVSTRPTWPTYHENTIGPRAWGLLMPSYFNSLHPKIITYCCCCRGLFVIYTWYEVFALFVLFDHA